MIKRVFIACGLVLLMMGRVSARPAAAGLDVHVKDVRAQAQSVRATIELRDVVPDRFKRVLDDGGPLHLRVQAELWESRPVWDQLVYPAIVHIFRLAQQAATRDIAIDDSRGTTAYRAIPNPMAIELDLGNRVRIVADGRYYVHVIATLGTVAERDVDDAEDAVFGRAADANSLGSFGRMLFRTAMKVGDYLQSVSAETKSRKIAGAEIIKTP
jgi:hypothetical protein